MTRFDDQTYYKPSDPRVRVIGTPGTLRVWRCKGRGPRYHKIGGRVVYLGADLNRFLDGCAIDPAAAA